MEADLRNSLSRPGGCWCPSGPGGNRAVHHPPCFQHTESKAGFKAAGGLHGSSGVDETMGGLGGGQSLGAWRPSELLLSGSRCEVVCHCCQAHPSIHPSTISVSHMLGLRIVSSQFLEEWRVPRGDLAKLASGATRTQNPGVMLGPRPPGAPAACRRMVKRNEGHAAEAPQWRGSTPFSAKHPDISLKKSSPSVRTSPTAENREYPVAAILTSTIKTPDVSSPR